MLVVSTDSGSFFTLVLYTNYGMLYKCFPLLPFRTCLLSLLPSFPYLCPSMSHALGFQGRKKAFAGSYVCVYFKRYGLNNFIDTIQMYGPAAASLHPWVWPQARTTEVHPCGFSRAHSLGHMHSAPNSIRPQAVLTVTPSFALTSHHHSNSPSPFATYCTCTYMYIPKAAGFR